MAAHHRRQRKDPDLQPAVEIADQPNANLEHRWTSTVITTNCYYCYHYYYIVAIQYSLKCKRYAHPAEAGLETSDRHRSAPKTEAQTQRATAKID